MNAAILLGSDEALEQYKKVKKAYSARSKVVHGAGLPKAEESEAYNYVRRLLAQLLAKCVELGRVPRIEEYDQAACRGSLTL
jgi:Tfp pilus assembly protein PilE